VRAFVDSATVVVVNEPALKDWIDDRVNGVLHHHIAEGRRIDPARFAMLIDHERAVRPGSIDSGCQLVSQALQLAAQIGLKAHHRRAIRLTPLGAQKCRIQGVDRANLLVQVAVAFRHGGWSLSLLKHHALQISP